MARTKTTTGARDAFEAWVESRWPEGIKRMGKIGTGRWLNIGMDDLRKAFEAGEQVDHAKGR